MGKIRNYRWNQNWNYQTSIFGSFYEFDQLGRDEDEHDLTDAL